MNGAQSSTGTTEAETNLKIALKVQNLLEQSGATVILTRSDENAIYDLDKNTLREKKISDIHNRVKIGNESQADIFVSIHLNKIPQEQYWGWQCFYRQNDEKSTKLAKCLQQNLNEAIDRENKRVAMKIDNVYIIKHVEIPISIVECGFLSNPEEEKQLLENTYQDKNIDTEKIFEKGISGKENHTGLGLWEVRKLIKKNNNINLYTAKNDKFFSQQLEIYY